MDDTLRQLLTDYIDGSLPAGQRRELEQLLERDAEAARFVAEHQWLWASLGEAFDHTGAEPSAAFRAQVLAAARPPRAIPWARYASLAAGLLVAVSVAVWFFKEPVAPGLSVEDREVVHYLHVLEHFELLDTRGRDLDLRRDLEVLRALEDV